ncbi:cupin domain-containing protein [Natronoarchaeum philippinense]|uniref:cupin domain-containing protein n=1 Tax=Natronoarchaeum philippinense TaxID=558529 RepID=UPI000BE32B36|nr:cupin domain-containing protein [Natronoarchaeum philippinense]
MYSKVSIDDVEERSIEDIEPGLKSVGYETRPDQMRPSVWEFEEGEQTNHHYHEHQEELYLVLDGRFHVVVGDDKFDLEPEDVLVVEPSAERQLTALETGRLFVVGAPNEPDDAVVVD